MAARLPVGGHEGSHRDLVMCGHPPEPTATKRRTPLSAGSTGKRPSPAPHRASLSGPVQGTPPAV